MSTVLNPYKASNSVHSYTVGNITKSVATQISHQLAQASFCIHTIGYIKCSMQVTYNCDSKHNTENNNWTLNCHNTNK